MNKKSITLDPQLFRNSLGHFLTGVAVATATDESNQPVGLTINSFTSVSLDPPLVLFCIGKEASCYDTFATTQSFAINVLTSNQEQKAKLFASGKTDKFEKTDWRFGVVGAPIIKKSLACIQCKSFNRIDAGDHLVIIGEVKKCEHTDSSPIGYFKGKYVSLTKSSDPLVTVKNSIQKNSNIIPKLKRLSQSFISMNEPCNQFVNRKTKLAQLMILHAKWKFLKSC